MLVSHYLAEEPAGQQDPYYNICSDAILCILFRFGPDRGHTGIMALVKDRGHTGVYFLKDRGHICIALLKDKGHTGIIDLVKDKETYRYSFKKG